MEKAGNESPARDQTNKRLDEAVRKLPIRPDRLDEVESAVAALETGVDLGPLFNVLPTTESRKIAPAAMSKQLDKIERLAKSLLNALRYLPDTAFLIETELRKLAPKDFLRERWGEEQAGPLYTCNRSLADLVSAVRSARQNHSSAPKIPGGYATAKGWVNRYVALL